MQQRNDHIMLNLESQRSLKQVEHIARTELGMVDPDYTSTLVLNVPPSSKTEMESRWVESPSTEGPQIVATLLSWVNKVLPIGGVEAGTLQR